MPSVDTGPELRHALLFKQKRKGTNVKAILNKEHLATARAQIKGLQRDLQAIEKQRSTIRDQIRENEQAIAEYIAEFKPGTWVLYNDKPFEITKVLLTYGDTVDYFGRQRRKDGSLGVMERRFYGHYGTHRRITLDPNQPVKP